MTISSFAFSYCDITSLKLPKGIKNIGRDAFGECDSLKNAVLPKSVHTIAKSLFYSCDELKP